MCNGKEPLKRHQISQIDQNQKQKAQGTGQGIQHGISFKIFGSLFGFFKSHLVIQNFGSTLLHKMSHFLTMQFGFKWRISNITRVLQFDGQGQATMLVHIIVIKILENCQSRHTSHCPYSLPFPSANMLVQESLVMLNNIK